MRKLIERMWMPLRAWWVLRKCRSQNKMLPSDVKQYFIRQGLKDIREAEKYGPVPPEKQVEIATLELEAALEGTPIDRQLAEKLLGDAFARMGQIPSRDCAQCCRPVFTHEAVQKDGKFYHESCLGPEAMKKSTNYKKHTIEAHAIPHRDDDEFSAEYVIRTEISSAGAPPAGATLEAGPTGVPGSFKTAESALAAATQVAQKQIDAGKAVTRPIVDDLHP